MDLTSGRRYRHRGGEPLGQPQQPINRVFEVAVDATSEAILNAMLAAKTMTGADWFTVYAPPHDRLLAALRKYGRMK